MSNNIFLLVPTTVDKCPISNVHCSYMKKVQDFRLPKAVKHMEYSINFL